MNDIPKTRTIEIRSKRHIKCHHCRKRMSVIIWEDGNGLHLESAYMVKKIDSND